MIEIVKWLGLLPAADGLLGQILDVDKMKEFDLLRGYLGAFPHAGGLLLFLSFRYAARRRNAGVATHVADRRKTGAAIWAAALILVCFGLWFVQMPDTYSPWLIRGRWIVATILYLLFYIFHGLSDPEV